VLEEKERAGADTESLDREARRVEEETRAIVQSLRQARERIWRDAGALGED